MNTNDDPALRFDRLTNRRAEGLVLSKAEGMLYSIVLKLVPTCETTIRATMGHQAHAAFLRTMREADSALESHRFTEKRGSGTH